MLNPVDDPNGELLDIKCKNIQTHISGLTKDLDKQENIHNIVESVLGSNIELREEQKHDILTQVETQH